MAEKIDDRDYDGGYDDGYIVGRGSRDDEVEKLEDRVSELEGKRDKVTDAIRDLWNMV